jgi:hypothetical protein
MRGGRAAHRIDLKLLHHGCQSRSSERAVRVGEDHRGRVESHRGKEGILTEWPFLSLAVEKIFSMLSYCASLHPAETDPTPSFM